MLAQERRSPSPRPNSTGVPRGEAPAERSCRLRLMASQAEPHDITGLLERHREGDVEALDHLIELIYPRLRPVARRQLARWRPGATLDTTALMHEAYLKLAGQPPPDWQDRSHFFAICAQTMRRIIVDHARRRGAQKRGGGVPAVTLDPDRIALAREAERVLAIETVLQGLESFNPRLARVFECRFFAGMTEQETADALDLSLRTAQREWMRARAWLQRELGRALLGTAPRDPVEP